MAAETDPPPTAHTEEQARRVPRWLVMVLGSLSFVGVVGVIVYGYLARPRPDWIGVADKQVWDWLDLLIVPAALAIGVYWLNRRQAAREQQAEDNRQEREEQAQAAQVKHALEVEDQRAQDAALQAYLDQMSQLLIDKDRPLRRAQPSDNLSVVARARTLTGLPILDGQRKRRVLTFLYEAGLITKASPVLDLSGADLSETVLPWGNLVKANLSKTNLLGSDLGGADLSEADLSRAILNRADLRHANLSGADLSGTLLNWAYLVFSNLGRADLSGAYLSGNPEEGGADLEGADLSGADLSEAKGWTVQQLARANSLEGATMPNGQKYEDWLKTSEGKQHEAVRQEWQRIEASRPHYRHEL